MKKIITVMTFILIITFLIGCNGEYANYLKTPRRLRKFSVKTEHTKIFSATYFLIFGSALGEEKNVKYISFWWECNSNIYCNARVMLKNIKIQIDNDLKLPYITIEEDSIRNHIESCPDYYDACLNDLNNKGHFIIHCNEKDFPINIDMSEL